MKLFQLHKIIESLTDEDVNLVRKALSVKGKKSKYVILLDVLRGTEEFSEDVESALKAKYFPRSDSLYRAKEKVLENIIQVYAKSGEDAGIGIDLVRGAFHLEAFDTGRKLLLQGIKSAQENRQIADLLKFHEFIYQLRNHFRIEVKLPKEVLTSEEIFSGSSLDQELRRLLSSSKEAFALLTIDRERIANSILLRLREIEKNWLPSPIAIKRVRVRALMLKQQFLQASELQNEIVSFYESENQGFAILLKELELRMRLLLDTGFRDQASGTLWTIGQLSPSTLLEQRVKVRSQVKNSLFLAFYNYSEDLINDAFKLLLENRELIERSKQPLNIYLSSILFLSIQDTSMAKKALKQLDSFTRTELLHLDWQIPLLRMLVAFENGEYDILGSLIRSSESKARESGLELPKLTTSFIRKCWTSPNSLDKIVEKYLSRIGLIMGRKDEKWAANFFNFEAWLLAKKQKTSMAQVELNFQRHEVQYSSEEFA